MNAMSGRWRRVAQKIVGHASWVLPRGQSSWGDAMWRELDYIEDDRAALRWAIGCITASYVTRLAALPRLGWRLSPRPVLAGTLLLSIGLAVQGYASGEASLLPSRSRSATCPMCVPTPAAFRWPSS
jgi:hypothetical protein